MQFSIVEQSHVWFNFLKDINNMYRSEGVEDLYAETNIYSAELIIAAFDRAYSNLSSDFLAHYLLKNDETFEKHIKVIFGLDKLFHELGDRNIQGLEISQSEIVIGDSPIVLRQYYYRRLNRKINVAAYKFTTDENTQNLLIKPLSNLDYKCVLFASIQK